MKSNQKQPSILGLDQGTHATKGILYDLNGNIITTKSVNISLNRISNESIEQNPEEILDSVNTVLETILNEISESHTITAAALATQRSSVVALSRESGRALSPVISWQDTRTKKNLEQIADHESHIKNITGLPLSAHYGASKIEWLLNNNQNTITEEKKGTLLYGPLVSYLLYNILTEKKYLIDHTNATRTLLFNIKTLSWDSTLLKLFHIRRKQLPSPQPVIYNYGKLSKGYIPLQVVSGDQNAALFFNGELPENKIVVNIGSGAFILKTSGRKIISNPYLLKSIARSEENDVLYTLEGTINGAGNAISWLAEKYNTVINEELIQKASLVESPPIFKNFIGGLGSPFWRSGDQPEWIYDHTKPSIINDLSGIIESIAFLISINIELLKKSDNISYKSISITGGLSNVNALCQKLADLNQIKVERYQDKEATIRGSAWMAAQKPKNWSRSPETTFNPCINTPLRKRFTIFSQVLDAVKYMQN